MPIIGPETFEAKWLRSPLRTLPSELLAVIFSFAICNQYTWNIIGARIDLPAARLSRVCSRWRDEVLTLPELWSSIHLRVTGYDDRFLRNRKSALSQALSLLLTRSKESPLRISLYIRNLVGSIDDAANRQAIEFANSFFEVLGPSSSRWQYFELDTDPETYPMISPPLIQLQGTFASLEHLVLSVGYKLQKLDIFNVAPKLRHAAFQFGTNPLIFHLPWDQLQALEMPAPDYIHSPLRRCANLRELYICVGDVQSSWYENIDMLTLPHLEFLAMSYSRRVGEDVEHLVSRLITPALKILKFRGTPSGGVIPMHILRDFINRSACAILDFEWSDIGTTVADFTSLMNVISSTKRMGLREDRKSGNAGESILADPFFTQLFAPTPLLPDLEELCVVVQGMMPTFSHQVLADLLLSSSPPKLRKVTVALPKQRLEEAAHISHYRPLLGNQQLLIEVYDRSGCVATRG